MNKKHYQEIIHFKVVAALISNNKEVLLSRRLSKKKTELTWEFPGGKVENGESNKQALIRELKEELGVNIEVGACCFETQHRYANKKVHLAIYHSNIISNKILNIKNVEWIMKNTLLNRNFPNGDLSFVQELVAGKIGEFKKDNILDIDDDEIKNFKPAKVIGKLLY